MTQLAFLRSHTETQTKLRHETTQLNVFSHHIKTQTRYRHGEIQTRTWCTLSPLSDQVICYRHNKSNIDGKPSMKVDPDMFNSH